MATVVIAYFIMLSSSAKIWKID